jgi:hypothetical protein
MDSEIKQLRQQKITTVMLGRGGHLPITFDIYELNVYLDGESGRSCQSARPLG